MCMDAHPLKVQQISLEEAMRQQLASIAGTDMDDVCARCKSIPWDELACSEPPTCSEGVPIIEVPETYNELLSSPCRICRLFATIKPKPGIVYSNRARASKLERPRPAEESPESWFLTRFSARSVLCDSGDDDIEFDVPNDGQVLGMMLDDAGVHNWFRAAGFLGLHQALTEADFGIRRINPAWADFDMIKDCLTICRNTHEECHSIKGPPIPGLRVIDCTCTVPEVIEAPIEGEYVALSYVWSMTGEDGAGFPPVIMDAITATVKMGFQYLWVDRHCIDQNDPEHRGGQIEHMGDIYARAAITILACSRNLDNYSLPGVGRCLRRPQREEMIGKIRLLEGAQHPAHELQESPWATRGWTLQEILLSSRRVIMSDMQVTYLCNATHWVESWERPGLDADPRDNWVFENIGLIPITERKVLGDRDAIRRAARILMEYSKRFLTYDTDALNAFRGIIQQLTKFSVFCPWGIPAIGDRFIVDWYHPKDTLKQRRDLFPSWSFLGWQGEIKMSRFGAWDSQRTKIALGSDREPALFLPLKGKLPTTEMLVLNDWRYLHITAPVAKLHIVCRTFTSQQRSLYTTLDLSHNGMSSVAMIPRPQDGWFASLQISEDVTMLLGVNLDVAELPTSVFGLVLHSETCVLGSDRIAALSMMVLEDNKSNYRRVGFTRYFLSGSIRPYSPTDIVPTIAFTNATGGLLDEVEWPIEVGEDAKSSAKDPLWLENTETKTIVVE